MNKMIFIAIGSIIGAAIGGGVAYVYLNKKYDVVFEKETESYRNEIDELKKSNHKLQKQIVTKLDDAKASLVIPENPDDIPEENEDNVDSEPITFNSDDEDIRLINVKDFVDDEDYEKEEIKYYSVDGIIAENDEILDEEEFVEICGSEALDIIKKKISLKELSGKDNEIYIRNENFNTDYKIIRYKESYGDHFNKSKE